MPGAPATPDIQKGIRVADVAALGRHAEATPLVKTPNMIWAEALSWQRQKDSAASVLRSVDKSDTKPTYDTSGSQHDAARLGGGAGKVDATGKAVVEASASQPQKERFEQGQKAIENVSAVMFYTEIARLPAAEQPARLAELQRNPAFHALGCADVAALQTRAVNAMLADKNVNDILDAMPAEGQVAYTAPEKQAIIAGLFLTDPDFVTTMSQNVQQVHERLLQLKPVEQSQAAKLVAEKATSDKTIADKAALIIARLKRAGDPALSAAITPPGGGVDVQALLNASRNEADFQKQLAIASGKITAKHYDDIAQVVELEKTIAEATIRKNGIPTTDAARVTAVGAEITALEAKLTAAKAHHGAPTMIDAEIAEYKKLDTAVAADSATRADILAGTKASIESVRLAAEITALGGGGTGMSGEMNARLDQERVIIEEMNKILGKSLKETYADREQQMEVLKDKFVQEALTAAGTSAEKDLILAMSTDYVSYDVATREKVIHGDNIMQATKLMSMGDRGLQVLMASDMKLGGVAQADLDAIFDADGPTNQQIAIDALLAKANATSESAALLKKAMEEHGSEYRLKVLEGYETMKDYLSDGFYGHALRPGKKIKYDGSGKGLRAHLKGESGMNATELQNMYKYCKADIEQAIRTNKDASKFYDKMVREGRIQNPDSLKKLIWWLMIILGGAGAAGATVLTGGAALPAVGAGLAGMAGGGIGGKVAGGFVSP